MKEMKMGFRRRRESGDYLASCMQMTWLCGESEEDLRAMWDGLLRHNPNMRWIEGGITLI